MPEHSRNTITQAIQIWTTKIYIPARGYDRVGSQQQVQNRRLTTSGSGGQSFLDGCTFSPDGRVWITGHLTLSPEDNLGFVTSVHLTLVGGSSWTGNYFFSVNDWETAPSEAPKQYKGQYSHNGNELPEALRAEVIDLFQRLLNEDP